jgi:hypothetical protein
VAGGDGGPIVATLDELKQQRAVLEQQLRSKEASQRRYQVRGKGRGPYADTQRSFAADLSLDVKSLKAHIAAIEKQIAEKNKTS